MVEEMEQQARVIILELIASGKTLEDLNLSPKLVDEVRNLVARTFGVDVFIAPKIDPIHFMHVEDLDISIRAKGCLTNYGITYVGELVQKSEGELLKMKHFGAKTLHEIIDFLASKNLHLNTRIHNWEQLLADSSRKLGDRYVV